MSTVISKKFDWGQSYDINSIIVSLYENSLTIYDSYKIKNYKHMKEVLQWISSHEEFNIKKPMWLLIAEWRTHNLLYKLNIQKERTKHVDLDNNQDWKLKLGYTILSLFYF